MMNHVTIFRQKGQWAATPANYGIWSWGEEIVVGFVTGALNKEGGFHAREKKQRYVTMQARSLDGGRTWKCVNTPCRVPGNCGAFSADEHMEAEFTVANALKSGRENLPVACSGGIDFTHPDFALMCARTGLGKGTVSWFYTSVDRCRSWDGPFSLPDFGLPGVEARTDYLVSGSEDCTLFLTAAKKSGGEGAGVFCARTSDGGQSFRFMEWVCQAEEGWKIMPASVRLSESRILVAVRCHDGAGELGKARNWIDLYASDDSGSSWSYLGRPVPNTGYGGNPPTLTRLRDGRLCITYGYRDAPYGIRARVSGDSGATWDEEIILRNDAGNHDIGYPRTTQLPDGTVVTVYWLNDDPEGERYIAATLWKP